MAIPKEPPLFADDEIELLSQGMIGIPVWQHWERFVQIRALSERSETTVRNIRDSVRYFALFGTLTTLESWVDKDVVFEVHKVRKDRGWSNCTFNTHRKNMSMYFGFLVEDGELISNPIKRVPKMPEEQKNYDLPTEDDFIIVIRYLRTRKCTNELERRRNLLFFNLLSEIGARPKELLDLRLVDVENRKELFIQGIKGGKPRIYPLSDTSKVLLRDYVFAVAQAERSDELDQYLFLNVKGHRKWTYLGMRKIFDRLNREAGVKSKITSYSFRRCVATSMLSAGIPWEQVMKHMGHSRFSTTMRYYQGTAEATRQGIEFMNGKFGNAFI